MSCRWQRAAEGDAPACCGHRDVLPMAGTTSFNPDSWCADCGYYKVKRAPKARPAPEARPIPAGTTDAAAAGALRLARRRPGLVAEFLRQIHPLAVGREELVGAPVLPGLG